MIIQKIQGDLKMFRKGRNIIQIRNSVLGGWYYFIEYSHMFPIFRLNVGNIWEYFVEYCQLLVTMLWIWKML